MAKRSRSASKSGVCLKKVATASFEGKSSDAERVGGVASSCTAESESLLKQKIRRLLPSTCASTEFDESAPTLPVLSAEGCWRLPVSRPPAVSSQPSASEERDNTESEGKSQEAPSSASTAESRKPKISKFLEEDSEIPEVIWKTVRKASSPEQRRILLAETASSILASPESRLGDLNIFFACHLQAKRAIQTLLASRDDTNRSHFLDFERRARILRWNEQMRLAVLSLAAVLKDVLPRHRLTAAAAYETAKKAAEEAVGSSDKTKAVRAFRLSKEVQKQQQHEEQLLSLYGRFLRLLRGDMKELLENQKKHHVLLDSISLFHAVNACSAAAEVLKSVPRFNESEELLSLAVKAASAAVQGSLSEDYLSDGESTSSEREHRGELKELGEFQSRKRLMLTKTAVSLVEALSHVVSEDRSLLTARRVVVAVSAEATSLLFGLQTSSKNKHNRSRLFCKSAAAAALMEVALPVDFRSKRRAAESTDNGLKSIGNDTRLRDDLIASSDGVDPKIFRAGEAEILRVLFILFAKVLQNPEACGAPAVLATLRGVCHFAEFIRQDLLQDVVSVLQKQRQEAPHVLQQLGPAVAASWISLPLFLTRRLRTSLQTDALWAGEAIASLATTNVVQFFCGCHESSRPLLSSSSASAFLKEEEASGDGGSASSFLSYPHNESRPSSMFAFLGSSFGSERSLDPEFASKLLQATDLVEQTPQLWGSGGAEQILEKAKSLSAATAKGNAAVRVDGDGPLCCRVGASSNTSNTACMQALLRAAQAFVSVAPSSDVYVARQLLGKVLKQLSKFPRLHPAVEVEGASSPDGAVSLHYALLLMSASVDPVLQLTSLEALAVSPENSRFCELRDACKRKLGSRLAQLNSAVCGSSNCSAQDFCIFSNSDDMRFEKVLFAFAASPVPSSTSSGQSKSRKRNLQRPTCSALHQPVKKASAKPPKDKAAEEEVPRRAEGTSRVASTAAKPRKNKGRRVGFSDKKTS